MLSDADLFIAASACAGTWADFSGKRDEDRRVDSVFLRRLFLGLPIRDSEHKRILDRFSEYRYPALDGNAAPAPLAVQGLRVRHAIIVGTVDLSMHANTATGVLPPLLLENCDFERDSETPLDVADLDISDSVITEVSLARSRLTYFRGERAKVLGLLSIAHTSSYHVVDHYQGAPNSSQYSSEGYCINLESAHVRGKLDVRYASLKLPEAKPKNPLQCSLQLAETEIGGTLDARGLTAIGGVDLTRAKVGSDVWLCGSTIVLGERSAFEGQGLRCHNLFAMDKPIRIKGGFYLTNAQIGGDMAFRDPYIDGQNCSSDTVWSSMNLYRTTIENSLVIDCSETPSKESEKKAGRVTGSIRLAGAKIGGSLIIRRIRLDGRGLDALHAPLIQVGENIRITEVDAEGSVQLPFAQVEAELIIHGGRIVGSIPSTSDPGQILVPTNRHGKTPIMPMAIGMLAANVGGSLSIGANIEIEGPISLERTQTGGDLVIRGVRMHHSPPIDDWHGEEKNTLREDWERFGVGLASAKVGSCIYFHENHLFGNVYLLHARAHTLCYSESGFKGAEHVQLDQFEYRTIVDATVIPHNKLLDARLGLLRKMEHENFEPQPYTILAQVLNRQGHADVARSVLVDKRRRECRYKRSKIFDTVKRISLRDGALRGALKVTYIIPQLLRWLTLILFGAFFGFGLKPFSALRTLVVFLVLGWLMFTIVESRSAMVISQQPVAGVVHQGVVGAISTDETVISNVSCGGAITTWLYATDVFIPLIDLRQETKCDIGRGDAPPRWVQKHPLEDWELGLYRFLKSAYSIFGWVLVSMAILTFSGLLRHYQLRE